jgi:L-amino acid N-acyltransferase YncA
MIIRLADLADVPAIHSIYAYYVRHTNISFEYEVPSEMEMKTRMETILARFPWLVAELDNQMIGYAYASTFRYREAYDWSVEASIYLKNDCQGKGWGTKLYQTLLKVLAGQGFVNVIGGVTIPNMASENLHTRLGFREVGSFQQIGYKFQEWHTIKFYELKINEYTIQLTKPMLFADFKNTPTFAEILARNNRENGSY